MDEIILILKEEKEEYPKKALRSGDLCPQCGQAQLDYDGMLNLACPQCGFAVGGCYT